MQNTPIISQWAVAYSTSTLLCRRSLVGVRISWDGSVPRCAALAAGPVAEAALGAESDRGACLVGPAACCIELAAGCTDAVLFILSAPIRLDGVAYGAQQSLLVVKNKSSDRSVHCRRVKTTHKAYKKVPSRHYAARGAH